MKKIILAAAVASVLAPVAAIADAKIYGAFRASLNTGDEEAFVNNASRLGVKGSIGEDGGLTGFYHIQMGAQNDDGGTALSSRFYFAGVKGSFGKVMVGRASSPYKMAGLKTDPFYDTSAGPANGGSNYGLSTLTNGFLNNVVGYVSPKLGGSVTLNAVAVLEGLENESNTDNLFNVGATYSAGPLTAAVQHITEIEATRISANYKAGAFGIGASYEDLDGGDQTYLSGTYKAAPKTTLAASIGQVDGAVTAGSRNAGGDGFSVGVFQKIAPKTTISLIHSSVDYDDNTTFVSDADGDGTNDTARSDRDVTSIGFVQKF